MNNWLVGEKSVNHIGDVTEALKKRRVSEAQNFFQVKEIRYTPFISHPKNYNTYSFETLKPLLVEDPPLDTMSILKLKEKLYYRIPSVQKSEHLSCETHLFPSSSEQLDHIMKEFDEAVEEIGNLLPWMGKQWKLVITEVCPIVKYEEVRSNSGLSDFRLIGSIFMSIRPNPDSLVKLMVSLAHELGHHILFYYQSGQDLFIEPFNSSNIYSSIRKTERSVYGSFQGCVAYAFMGLVVKKIVEKKLSRFNLPFSHKLANKYTQGLAEGLAVFSPEMMTPLGKKLLLDLGEIEEFLRNE